MKIKLAISFIFLMTYCYSQLSFRQELINSKCELFSIMHRNDESLTYIKKEAAAQYRTLPELTMEVCVFDTSKAESKKRFRGLNYKRKDTILVYGWDKEILLLPFHVSACKFEYQPKDSVLIFTDIQKIYMDVNAPESRFTQRRFKMVMQNQEEFVLRDLDIYDVQRDYYFKKTKKEAVKKQEKKNTKKP